MDERRFLEQLKEKMEKLLKEECEVNIRTADRFGGRQEGIGLRFNGSNAELIVYPSKEEFFDMSTEEIAEALVKKAREEAAVIPRFPKERGEFQNGLHLRVANTENNTHLIEGGVIHDRVGEDITALLYCDAMDNKNNIGEFLVGILLKN